jgi:hypothetical protein
MFIDKHQVTFSRPDLNGLVKSLEKESAILIDWFAINKMNDNPDTFQAIAIGDK